MRELSGVRRGFCGAESLTRYICEYLGHEMPRELTARTR